MMAFIESTKSTAKMASQSHSEIAGLIKQKQTTLKKPPAYSSPPGLEAPPGLEMKAENPNTFIGGTTAAAAILLELVAVVAQIANLDKMLDTVRGSAPSESSEAEHWHHVSMQALDMSRKALHEKQMTLLQSLANALPGQSDAVPLHIPNCAAALSSESKFMEADPEKAQSECSTMIPDECRSERTISGNEAGAESSPCSLAVEQMESATSILPGEESNAGNVSLRQDLEKLKKYPAGQSIIARKIKNLGFESPELLKSHFEQYGAVAEVLVAHSITKPSAKRTKGRVRPAAVGFVVMASLEGANAAFAAGEVQVVKTGSTEVSIEIGHFEEKVEL